MEEAWKAVPGWPGYSVSNIGNVKSFKTDSGHRTIILKQFKDRDGYVQFILNNGPKRALKRAHRLVLEAFVGPCPSGFQCAHLNGVPDDNRLKNLKWCSPKENTFHKKKHGTSSDGEKNPAAKVNWKIVTEIRKSYVPYKTSRKSIASRFNIKISTLDSIIQNIHWKPKKA